MKNKEGFWDKDSRPISGKFSGRKQFLMQLLEVEKKSEKIPLKRGSICLICGEYDGTQTIQYANWEWPSGYSHYVEEHRVVPSTDFIFFIAASYKDLRKEEFSKVQQVFKDVKFSKKAEQLVELVQGYNAVISRLTIRPDTCENEAVEKAVSLITKINSLCR